MKNIKITPYPNLKITEECFERDIKPNTAETINNGEATDKVNFNNPVFMILEFSNGDKRVVRPGPTVLAGNEKYCSVFPNPVHLFFDTSISLFNQSEQIKQNSFPKCAKEKNKKLGEIYFLDIDADETHLCYNEFFKLRINSIIMLSTSVEAFINHSIPNSYPDRTDVERYGKFKEKLKTHLPDSLSLINFWDDKNDLFDEIMKLYGMRNDLIHLKTNSQDDFEAYFEVVNRMLDYDILNAITLIGQFMNAINPRFIVHA